MEYSSVAKKKRYMQSCKCDIYVYVNIPSLNIYNINKNIILGQEEARHKENALSDSVYVRL